MLRSRSLRFGRNRVPLTIHASAVVVLFLLASVSLSHAGAVLSAGEPNGNEYQDLIGSGGTVQGDIFGGEQVQSDPVGPLAPALETESPRHNPSMPAARYDAVWMGRLWSWLRMVLAPFAFTTNR